MSASRLETLIAQALTVLQAAGTGATVTRRRVDAYDASELPVIEIIRGAASAEAFGDKSDHWRAGFTLSLLVTDDAMAESALDAVWCAAHAPLISQLNSSECGLRCTGTSEPEQVAVTEGVAARMTCTYEFQLLTRRGDLSRAMT